VHREIKENLQTANVSNVELNALQRQRPADVSRGRDFVREVKIGEVGLCLGFNSLNERFSLQKMHGVPIASRFRLIAGGAGNFFPGQVGTPQTIRFLANCAVTIDVGRAADVPRSRVRR